MHSCQNCAQPLPEGAKFCPNCGVEVPVGASVVVDALYAPDPAAGGYAQTGETYDLLPPADDTDISSMLQPNADVFVPPDESGLAKGILAPADYSADEMFEAIIGTNEIVDHGIAAGLIERGRSVARIRVLGHQSLTSVPPAGLAVAWDTLAQNGQLTGFVGTGWILGSARKVILTNNHVIPLPVAAATARLEFAYQRDILRNRTTTGPVLRLSPDELFFSSPTMSFGGLDYTAVALAEQAPQELGYLDFVPGNSAVYTELVYVVQHPGGDPKAYVVNHNRKINLSDNYLTYTSDTKGGSSGSPLFDDDLNLIGLHHIGNHRVEVNGQTLYTNLGSRIEVVLADLVRQLHETGWDEADAEVWFGEGVVLKLFREAANRD